MEAVIRMTILFTSGSEAVQYSRLLLNSEKPDGLGHYKIEVKDEFVQKCAVI